MSIAHRLEDEEMSDISLCDLLVAMGERSTARLLDKSMPFRLRASEACGEAISHANDPDHPRPPLVPGGAFDLFALRPNRGNLLFIRVSIENSWRFV
jgi:hypothetical protein